ncbi:hypothetical protein EW145_g1164 [Phellinidium pouzarii]|uniref:Uncharacterized protein n=1 Tax=Phellinidium pouzarii TaxID=167371 RepID=A0A4S4LG27_9AGAM|nr:hypothetical protein EW145_g1164 [Phellinidium pouzarii]
MVSRVEKKVIWHPRQENKFIVGGGSQMTLFEWELNVPEFRLVTSQADLQLMKCFAWSPDPTLDNLIAVGSSTGKVDFWRMEANRYAKNNMDYGGPEMTLPVRSTRSCNTLAFCLEKPNLLAVGLDKVRGDPSLVVWDIEAAAAALSSVSKPFANGGPTSVRPSMTVKADRPLVQQYAPAEVVSSVAFLPASPNLLVAGVSNLWLRLFDLRVNGLHVSQAPAAKVHGIATDPFDSHRISCFGESTVTIWDSRKISQSLLTFSLKDAAADGARYYTNEFFNNVEFSRVRRGTLATLTRDANHVRFWDIQQAPSHDTTLGSEDRIPREVQKEVSRSSKLSRLSWAAPSTMLPWNASSEQMSTPSLSPAGLKNAVLSNTSRTKAFSRSIISFALVPSPFTHPLTSNIVVVSKEGDIEMHDMHDVPKHAVWSPRGELALGAGTQFRVFPGFYDSEKIPEPWDLEASFETNEDRHSSNIKGRAGRPHSRMDDNDKLTHRQESKDRPSDLVPTTRGSSLMASRITKSSTYSPVSVRRNSVEHSTPHDKTALASAEPQVTSDTSRQDPSVHLQDSPLYTATKSKRAELSRSASRNRRRLNDVLSPTVIESDISMIMRSRVLHGYGLFNAHHNSVVISSQLGDDFILSDIWTWFNHSKYLLTFGTAKIHGIDFSYQGILGIWEGLEASSSQEVVSLLDSLDLAAPSEASSMTLSDSSPSVDVNASLRPRLSSNKSHRLGDGFHGNYTAALNTLNSRSNSDKSAWKSTVHTEKSQQRRLALALCDWKVGEEEFSRWEKEGKHSQAACWLLFTNQGGRAIDMLMKSKNESHQMMSGTFAAMLQSGSSSRNHELRDYCERLIVKLQDPHFRIMLSYIVFNDWSDVVEEEALPLRERIAIALRFLEDKDLTSYLRRVADDCRAKGSIEGLMVTGLTSLGLDILQGYVDTTGDVQTAALLASYVCPGRYKDARAERWVEAYRDLLDGWRLFHHRCQFDINRGKILEEGIQNGDFTPMEWVKKQFLIRCNFCNKVVNTQQQQRPQEPIAMQRKRAAACPLCGRALPRCSVCLMSISIVPDSGRECDLFHSSFRDTVDDAFVFCQSCRHGGHAGHIIEWFLGEGEEGDRRRRTCPVADCDCYCDEDGNY